MIKISANRVSVGKFYPASPLLVWDLITDTTQWPRWGPTVKRVQFPERFIRKGSSGQVITAFGIWLPFVIDEYEHACFWSWKVAAIKATGHRIQTTETGNCCLWFEVPIIAAPYTLICQMALGRIENLLCE
jgi:hypothetical protein